MRRTAIVLGVLGTCAGGVLAYADASPLWQRWREYKRFQDLLATPTVRRATGADWFAKHPPGGDKSCDAPETLPADFFDKHPPGDGGPCYESSADGKLHWIEVKPRKRDWPREEPGPGREVKMATKTIETEIDGKHRTFTADVAEGSTPAQIEAAVREYVKANPELADAPTGKPLHIGQIVKAAFRLESFAPDPNRDGIGLIRYDVSGSVTSLELAAGEKIERPRPPSFLRAFVVPLLFPVIGFLLAWGGTKAIAWVATGFIAPKGA
jgi:hypothetical protein